MRFILASVMIALLSCCAKNQEIQKFPVPPIPDLEQVKILSCVSIDEVEVPEVFVTSQDWAAFKEKAPIVCIKIYSQYRFMEKKKVLLNDQELKHYIETLLSSPYLKITDK